jgi:hypothetical protein
MHSRSVLVHCPSRLGTAAAVLNAEVRCRDGVFATQACERGHAVDHLDDVMSHSFKSSPLSRDDYETNVTKGRNPRQPMCLRSAWLRVRRSRSYAAAIAFPMITM